MINTGNQQTRFFSHLIIAHHQVTLSFIPERSQQCDDWAPAPWPVSHRKKRRKRNMFAIKSWAVYCWLLFLFMGQKYVPLPVDKCIPQGRRVLLDASQKRLWNVLLYFRVKRWHWHSKAWHVCLFCGSTGHWRVSGVCWDGAIISQRHFCLGPS